MSKKLFTVLAPLVAITAFVVMPAVAQAVPHNYKNNTIIGESEKPETNVISWGTLTLTPEPPVAPTTTCENAAGGVAGNPVGGGAGFGQTNKFASWNCVNAGCPAGKVKIGEAEFEKVFQVLSFTLPWPSELINEVGIRTNSTNVEVTLGCYAKGSHNAAEPGKPGYNEEIALAAPTVCVTTAEHQQKPLNVKGTNATNPSKVSFDANAGTLSCAGGAVSGKTSGTLKLQGYTASEVMTTKDP